MTESRRPRRVAETIRKHVAEALSRELFDPRLHGLMVTRVDLGSDLSFARVYVRSMAGATGEDERARIEEAARRAGSLLRRGLGERLGLRRVPELKFTYDRGQDAVDRVEALLGEIERERQG